MSHRELICINCPMGCIVNVELDDNTQEVLSVQGNQCPAGDRYVRKELKDPRRVVCSTIPLVNGINPLVSCKTAQDIPKDKIFDVMKEINAAKAKAPVHIGDVLIENVAGTGVNVVATQERIASN